jgi:hypothetical protein
MSIEFYENVPILVQLLSDLEAHGFFPIYIREKYANALSLENL